MGPWPTCCDQVRYEGNRLVIAGQEPGPTGSLLDAMSHLGPEYFLAFAAQGLYSANARLGSDPAADKVVRAALLHAEQLAVERSGGQDPGVAGFLGHEAIQSVLRAESAHGYGGELEERWYGIASLAQAASSGAPEEMIQLSINAMAHAANTILIPHWESILWRPLWGESELRTDAGQWVAADELLEHFYRMLNERLSPWLLGFRPGPLED
jgi:hypothetical protein